MRIVDKVIGREYSLRIKLFVVVYFLLVLLFFVELNVLYCNCLNIDYV